jgi:hypothetical protein
MEPRSTAYIYAHPLTLRRSSCSRQRRRGQRHPPRFAEHTPSLPISLHTFRRHTELIIFIARFRAYLPPANKRLIAGTPTRRTLTSDREFTTYICVLAATRMRPRDFLLFRRSASGYSFRPVPSIFFLFPADPASAHGGLGNGAAMQTLLPVDTSRRRPQVRYHPFHLMGLGTRVSWSNRNFTGRNSLN